MAGQHHDAIVIGGGHNGLVTAAYLGRAGLSTLLLERRETLGGAAVTGELAPGFRVPTLAHTVGRLRPSVAHELGLARHGLQLVQPQVRAFMPFPDGRSVTLWGDTMRTVDELRSAWTAADADGYLELDRLVGRLSRFLGDVAATTPPETKGPSLADAWAGLRLGRSFRSLGRRDAATLLRVLAMAVADFVAEHLRSDAVQAAVAVRGVLYCHLGPWSAGTTEVLLMDSAGNGGGAAGQTVFARGGPGALSEALAAAATTSGVEIRTGAEVGRVLSVDGHALGVALASGEELRASAVVSSADPKRTLLGLVDPVELGPHLSWRVSNYRMPGATAKVNLALGALPVFPAANAPATGGSSASASGDGAARLRGRILLADGIDPMERAFDACKYGEIPAAPVLEATIPSLVDPSLAPEGKQVMSVTVQYAPYALREGDWDARRDELADRVMARLERAAPGIGALVEARQVITPLDLERDHALTGGHPLHGEPSLDQFFAWRPMVEMARYRSPIEGLYLAGSGTHPGGGITGGPGANAAREIIADLKKRRRRR